MLVSPGLNQFIVITKSFYWDLDMRGKNKGGYVLVKVICITLKSVDDTDQFSVL